MPDAGSSLKTNKLFAWLNLSGIALVLLSVITLISVPLPAVRLVPGLLLLCFLPGLAVVFFLFGHKTFGFWEILSFSFGISLALACLEFFISFCTLKNMSLDILTFILCFPALIFFTVNLFRSVPGMSAEKNSSGLWIFAVLFIATLLRLTYLGYSDYQGDEAFYCLSNSIQLLKGDMDALFGAQKPPAEIILTSISHFLFNTYNEFYMRIPFCLTGIFCVLAFYLLGRRLFGKFEAVAAGLLGAVNGYFVIFSRIVQYQSIVILCGLMSVLMLYESLKSNEPKLSYLLCMGGVFFAGFGIFTHYDGFFVLPAAAYLLFQKFKNQPLKKTGSQILSISTIFMAITGSFYFPFLLHPRFTETALYYQHARFRALLNFNMDALFKLGSLYTPKIYLLLLLIFSLIFIVRRMDLRSKILGIWFLFPFLFLMVFCSIPGTHIYNFFPAWCLAAAAGFGQLYESSSLVRTHHLKAACQFLVIFIFSAVILYSGVHIYQRFLDHQPEFLWSDKAKKIPHRGLFGFPYHRGWKAAGYLFRSGELKGSYKSNEKEKITNYYLRQECSEDHNPDFIVHAWQAQSWQGIRIPAGYRPFINIFSRNKSLMFIYRYSPDARPALKNYDANIYEKLYDRLDMEIK